MEERYIRNLDDIFTENLQNILLTKNIAIIGCGGQGGYIAEFIARLGVKSVMLWDGDVFDESNLNRQIACLENTIGQNKVKVIANRIKQINANLLVEAYDWYFGDLGQQDVQTILSADIIFIACDDSHQVYKTREHIRQAIEAGIPAIDCPNNILGGFISITTKNDFNHYDYFTDILVQQTQKHYQKGFSQAYKCALIAAEAVNAMVQYFNNCRFAPIDSLLDIDIYHHKYTQSDKYGLFF